MAQRQNTGNPMPSNSFKDLNDNTIIIDEWTNSTSDYTQDRFGIKFKTRYKILYDLQASINNIQSGSFLPLSGGTLTGALTGTDITAKTSLTVGSAKATYSTNGLNFDKALLINNVAALKVGDYGVGAVTPTVITGSITQKLTTGFYTITSATTGEVPFTLCNLFVQSRNDNLKTAIAFDASKTSPPYYIKTGVFTDGKWSWQDVITSGNIGNYQLGLGVNQTWQNVTSSRVAGTVYTNTTGKPIQIYIKASNVYSNTTYAYLDVNIDGISFSPTGGGVSQGEKSASISIIIPNGSEYSIKNIQSNTLTWLELR